MSKKKPVAEEAPAVPIFDPTVMVRLVANDGHVVYCDRNAARVSKVLKAALLGMPAGEGEYAAVEGVEVTNARPTPVITVPFLDGPNLEAAVGFMQWKVKADGEPVDHRAPLPAPFTPIHMAAIGTLLRC